MPGRGRTGGSLDSFCSISHSSWHAARDLSPMALLEHFQKAVCSAAAVRTLAGENWGNSDIFNTRKNVIVCVVRGKKELQGAQLPWELRTGQQLAGWSMTWLENLANIVTTGVVCTYAAYDLYRRWQNNAEQGRNQVSFLATVSV
jgi:hypothetical protein